MSAFRTENLENHVVRETARASRNVREDYAVPLAVSLFLILYFVLCGYIVVHGSTVLSSMDSSEVTTLYGP